MFASLQKVVNYYHWSCHFKLQVMYELALVRCASLTRFASVYRVMMRNFLRPTAAAAASTTVVVVARDHSRGMDVVRVFVMGAITAVLRVAASVSSMPVVLVVIVTIIVVVVRIATVSIAAQSTLNIRRLIHHGIGIVTIGVLVQRSNSGGAASWALILSSRLFHVQGRYNKEEVQRNEKNGELHGERRSL
jgi:hypothetical protein